MEYVALGDTVRFGITLTDPSGSLPVLINADETPRWYVYTTTSGDNPLMQGNFGLRTNLMGTYSGVFVASSANNFITGDFCEVHASGKVNNVVGRAIIKTFVLDDLYKANVIQVSGLYVTPSTIVDANLTEINGSGIVFYDELPANMVKISGVSVATSNYVEDKVWNARQDQHNTNETFGSGINKITQNLYFANIKFDKDSTVPQDEYNVNWFKNALPIVSGQITNPALSVFKTDGTNGSLFTNKVMNYANVNMGTVRYNEVTNLAVSGEVYLAVASGIIDGLTRTWQNLIGLDSL